MSMADEWDVQKILNLYSEGATRRDFDQVIATFTPDAVWEVEGTEHRFVGHDALLQAFRMFTASTHQLVQINAPAVISVEDDRATARSSIREVGRLRDRDVAFDCVGTYFDDLVRTPQGWRFTRRRFVTLGINSFDVHPGAAVKAIDAEMV